MENYNLFLDDIRCPSACLNYQTKFMPENKQAYSLEDWVIARDFVEFTQILQSKFSAGEFPGLISFDHDLADVHYNSETLQESFEYHEKTGGDCANFLVQFCLEHDLSLPIFWIHSANPVGSERIYANIMDYFRYKGRF